MRRTKHRRRYFTGKVISKRKREATEEGAEVLPNGKLKVHGHYRHMSRATRRRISKMKQRDRRSRRRRESRDMARMADELA